MGSIEQAEKTLREIFGHDTFMPGQRQVVERLLGGESTVAIFPTGGGKSLCYQLPALLFDGLTVVVSPLIALMKDQIDVLQQKNIAAARLDSTLDAEQTREIASQIRSGELKILYVAPERFNNERFRDNIRHSKISLFAIDEAHCISEWGHNFRPDYLKLAEFARDCNAQRVLGLTATATPKVEQDICRQFKIGETAAVRTEFYRENLNLKTTVVHTRERMSMLLDRLKTQTSGPTIVYVTLQKTAEFVAQQLTDAGLDAKAYHAGLKDDLRTGVQEWFMGSDDSIVVATIAFGMGIDKSNIRYVYHYNLPKSIENYSQEIGRAGRDGQPAQCEIFAVSDDLNVLETFVYGDTPDLLAVERLVQLVFDGSAAAPDNPDSIELSMYQWSGQSDIRPLVLRTLLTYLELDGYLAGGTPFYNTFQFRPVRSSAQMLSEFDADRQEFLKSIFSRARKAKIWFDLDITEVVKQTGHDRQRIVRALDFLAERGDLELKVSGLMNRYQILKRPEDAKSLAKELHARMLKLEAAEIDRLWQIVNFIQQDSCQVNHLSAHFGERRESACGHCSYCLTAQVQTLPPRESREIDPAVIRQARALAQQHPDELYSHRANARLLCGITSPKLTTAKLTKNPLFGKLDQQPFTSVLQALADR